MSGGHYNYLYSQIENTYENELEYPILEALLKDFCQLLKALEWYQSGDTCQEDYRKFADKFIKKWLKSEHSVSQIKNSEFIMEVKDMLNHLEQKYFQAIDSKS